MKKLALALLLAGCQSFEGAGLVPGQSTTADVEKAMGAAADKRTAANGETLYYYPRLPWGYATYVARVNADGKLVAMEQRLTPENTARIKVGASRGAEVRELLGPPYEPMKRSSDGNEFWTYPMRIPGDPTPKWFLVRLSPDDVVREAYTINDPNYNFPDGMRMRR